MTPHPESKYESRDWVDWINAHPNWHQAVTEAEEAGALRWIAVYALGYFSELDRVETIESLLKAG